MVTGDWSSSRLLRRSRLMISLLSRFATRRGFFAVFAAASN